MARVDFDPKAANVWTARIIPLILIGIVGYASWVVVALLSVDYLLKGSSSSHGQRQRTAVAVIVLYCILVLVLATTFLRLIYTVTTNPGYVPRGARWYENKEKEHGPRSSSKKRKRDAKHRGEKTIGAPEVTEGAYGNHAYIDGPPVEEFSGSEEESSNLRDIYIMDIFTCEGDGRPVWCSTCLNFKPDRAHHCREVGRCVRKMDHFCPWVGGIISETSFKFFVQFVFWGAVFCVFNLAVMAVFVAERRNEGRDLSVHWIVVLACGALFGLFSLGMTLSSMQFVFLNTTTIENLSRHSKVWSLAVLMPTSIANPPRIPFNTITYPLGYIYPNQDEMVPQPQPPPIPPRKFAILHSRPGENIWDLGYWRNFKSVMGERWYDWFLPVKYSPCCKHESVASRFEMGPVVDCMRERAGLRVPYEAGKPERRRRRKRRVQRNSLSEERATRRSRRKDRQEEGAEMVQIGDADMAVR